LDSWYAQRCRCELSIVIVDFSDEPSSVDVSRVRLLRPTTSLRWNPCRARNIGARNSFGQLLVFAGTDVIVSPDFLERIDADWDRYDAWVAEDRLSAVPANPALDNLIAVKRWVNTRVRGFHEPLMEHPYGWGFGVSDYELRVRELLRRQGASCGGYGIDTALVLPRDAAERAATYDQNDIEATYEAHVAYSRWYRERCGVEANIGHDWGQL